MEKCGTKHSLFFHLWVFLPLLVLSACGELTETLLEEEVTVRSVYPPLVTRGDASQTVTVYGSGFSESSIIEANGTPVKIEKVISDSEVRISLPASDQIENIDLKISNGKKTTTASAAIRRVGVLGNNVLEGNRGTINGMSSPRQILKIDGKLFVMDAGNYRINVYNSIPTANFTAPDFTVGERQMGTLEPWAMVALNSPNEAGKAQFSGVGMATDGKKLIVADSSRHRVLIWNTIPRTQGQSADFVLGQANFLGESANTGGGVSSSSLKEPASVAISDGKLIVADTGNHRVLIWNSIPQANNVPADIVIGQGTSFNTSGANQGGRSAATLSKPEGVAVAAGRLLIADTNNHRILVWNTVPTTSGTTADLILGQTTPTAATANRGGSPTLATLSGPRGLWWDGTRLFVAETGNHRVLVWNSFPTTTGQAGNFVIGQASGTTNASATTASGLKSPSCVYSDGVTVFICDTSNYRVLKYALPSTDGAVANLVLGQPNFTTALSRNKNDSTKGNNATDVEATPTHIFLADRSNNRVLIWNSPTPGDGAPPDVILGQSDINNTSANRGLSAPTASTLSGPVSVLAVNGKLVVSDTGNHRVLIWNTIPTTSGQAASYSLGQPGLVTGVVNNGGMSASTLSSPHILTSDGTNLVLADQGNHRILIWDHFPTAQQTAADRVLGQVSFVVGSSDAGTGAVNRKGFNNPTSPHFYQGKLLVADNNNHRVLAWTWPVSSSVDADYVFGQQDFVSKTLSPTNDHQTISPAMIITNEKGDLIIGDGSLRLGTIEKADFQSSILNWKFKTSMIGQPDANTYLPRDPVYSIQPFGGQAINGYIYVSDYSNGRILIIKQ